MKHRLLPSFINSEPDRQSFVHPDEVLEDARLTLAQKRETLAAWASDAHAVPDAPGLRQLDCGAVVPVDAVLGALRALDRESTGEVSERTKAFDRRRATAIRRAWRAFRRRDHDDDPPPCPAAALPFEVEAARRRKWDSEPEPLAA